jgi:hypothetical protein
MKYKRLFLVWTLVLLSLQLIAQDKDAKASADTKSKLESIPRHTTFEKLIWVHRVATYLITKERKVTYDTAYIKSNYKRMVVTLPVSTRFLKFSLVDTKTNSKLTFAPNLQYNLGISISSRWATFILHSGVKLFNSDSQTKGKTSFQDYQLNLYGRRFTTDMFFQYYKGFYIQNSQSFANYSSTQTYQLREDVYALNMGVNSYYSVNHKHFSYGNSFSFVEQQKKSAGSLLLGLYYFYFSASGSPSLVSSPFRDSFDTLSYIQNGHTHNFGFNLGYIYTLVFLKKCYATASLVQGIGGQQLAYERDDKTIYKQWLGGAGKLNVRLATGYDSGRYFIGTMAMFNYFLFTGKTNSTFDYSFGKFMVYVGYRFSILKTERRLLKRLKFIDY